MKDKPVQPPDPVPDLELLRGQVRDLTAIKTNRTTGFASGLDTWCGHADHPTMNALGVIIAEKLNWRAEALRSRQRIADLEATVGRARALITDADGNPTLITLDGEVLRAALDGVEQT